MPQRWGAYLLSFSRLMIACRLCFEVSFDRTKISSFRRKVCRGARLVTRPLTTTGRVLLLSSNLTRRVADRSTPSRGARSSVQLCVSQGHLEAVLALLEGGASPDGRRARSTAPSHPHDRTATANPASRGSPSSSPSSFFSSSSDESDFSDSDISDYPGEWEGDLTPLHLASEAGQLEVMAALVTAGADVDAGDEIGNTPLHVARDARTLEFLLEHGANPNLVAYSEYGSGSPLGSYCTLVHRLETDEKGMASATAQVREEKRNMTDELSTTHRDAFTPKEGRPREVRACFECSSLFFFFLCVF